MNISFIFYACAAALFAIGLYGILAEKLQLPSLRAIVVFMTLTGGRHTSSGESLLLQMAGRLQKLIRLSPYRHRHIEQKLSQAELEMSPELYVSSIILIGAIAVLPAIAFLFIFPLLSIPCALLAVWIVIKQLNSINKRTGRHHDALEVEYPRFASAIEQSQSQKDVIYILKSYRPIAGKAMQKELDILIADMSTGDPELALSRFEYRLNSEHGNSIVRALIGMQKGEDMQAYLNGLTQELNEWNINRLRLLAQKRPDELKPSIYVNLAAVCILYVAVFGTTIWTYLSFLLFS